MAIGSTSAPASASGVEHHGLDVERRRRRMGASPLPSMSAPISRPSGTITSATLDGQLVGRALGEHRTRPGVGHELDGGIEVVGPAWRAGAENSVGSKSTRSPAAAARRAGARAARFGGRVGRAMSRCAGLVGRVE